MNGQPRSRALTPVLLLVAASALAVPAAAQGLDVALAVARGQSDHVSKVGVIVGHTRADPLWQGERWRLMLRHEVELAAWRVPKARNLVEIGYSPVVRLERPLAASGNVFFVEGAIGARLLSHTWLSDERRLGTAFQFADMLGAGWQWGREGQSTLGIRLEHVSNADIKQPNSGINFIQAYYRYRF